MKRSLGETNLLESNLIEEKRLEKAKACENEIRITDPAFVYADIPFDDRETLELFSNADTDGIQDFNAPGYKKWLRDIKPESFEDLVSFYALYRPGSMKQLPSLIEGKCNPQTIVYPAPSLKDILVPTYGILVYREQLMQIVHDYSGLSMDDSNKFRLNIQKKRDIQSLKTEFTRLSICQGHEAEEVCNVFDFLLVNSAYAVPKCKILPFVTLAYKEAYIKSHYSVVFGKYFLADI